MIDTWWWQALGGLLFILVLLTVSWCIHDAYRELEEGSDQSDYQEQCNRKVS